MKLLRYGDAGAEKWGMLDAEQRIRTLDDALVHVTGDELSQLQASAHHVADSVAKLKL